MIGSLTLIFFCQLVGEIISRLTKLPIPGPVIGMVILFCGLLIRKTILSELETVSGFLHLYLPLLFVPAGVGVIKNLDLLKRYWVPFTGAIIIGTAVTIAVTGVFDAKSLQLECLADKLFDKHGFLFQIE